MDKFQTLKIESFSNSGEGIGKLDGFVVFVENALPDELVEVEIIKDYNSLDRIVIIRR